MNLPGSSNMMQNVELRTLLGKVEKGRLSWLPATQTITNHRKRWVPSAAGSCSKRWQSTRWKSKNSQLFHFTYTNYQVESCKFGDQVGGSKFIPRKVFPEGFMPEESSMSHTLAQNCHCEFVVECILRAKQSSYTWQEGVNERPRKSVKALIAIASVFAKLKLMWKNRLRQQRSKIAKVDMEVLGLSLFSSQKKIVQVRRWASPSICHKSHFIGKFIGKMLQPSWSTLIKRRKHQNLFGWLVLADFETSTSLQMPWSWLHKFSYFRLLPARF